MDDFSLQLSQLSFEDQEAKSVLIDFGGISCYQCNLQTKSINTKMSRAFHAWRQILIQKSQKNEQDIENILLVDKAKINIFFQTWTYRYENKIMQRQFGAFRTWKILANSKKRQRERDEQKAIECIDYWRNLAMNRVFVKHKAKRLRRKYFRVWLVHFKYQQKIELVRQKADKIRVKKFMRLLKIKYRIHKNKTNQIKANEIMQRFTMNRCFDIWRCGYLSQIRKVPRKQIVLRSVFHKWKEALVLTISLRKRFEIVASKRSRVLEMKSISKWKLRYRNVKRRKHRKIVNIWARVVIREITYSRVQLLRARILQNMAFRKMKLLYRQANLNRMGEFFQMWELYVQRKRQKRECEKVRVLYAYSRYFGRWQLLYDKQNEQREIDFVRARVVDIHLKRKTFMLWIDRAIKSYKQRQILAIRFRKRQIKIKFFNAWHNCMKMKQARAEEYCKSIYLNKYFHAFLYVALTIPRQNEEKALAFHKNVLKKRYFNRLKACIGSELDDNMAEIIAALNGENMYSTLCI